MATGNLRPGFFSVIKRLYSWCAENWPGQALTILRGISPTKGLYTARLSTFQKMFVILHVQGRHPCPEGLYISCLEGMRTNEHVK